MSKKTSVFIDTSFPKLPNPDDSWIRGHYHCKKCGGEIKCWKGLPWKVEHGVRRIGGCVQDDLLMIEYERGEPKWVQL